MHILPNRSEIRHENISVMIFFCKLVYMTRNADFFGDDDWIAKLKFLPTHSGDLINSFRAHVEKDANGDVAKISFTFLYYGFYVDAGAGPGYRTPKRWFNKIYWREFQQLGRLMAAQYGQEWIEDVMKSIETINLRG